MSVRLLLASISVLIAALSLGACATTTQNTATAAPTTASPPPAAVPAVAPSDVSIIERQAGEGPAVEKGNPIAVHYTGYLWDSKATDNKGAKFDSSVEKGVPLGFIVGAGRVIAGWDVGVMGMQVGGQRTLIIPADKAYGDKGSPPNIPPNAVLVFDLELMSIIGKTKQATATASPFVPAPKK
jgi:FKBP-type peptidyl-prolyl cis-trans isomerase